MKIDIKNKKEIFGGYLKIEEVSLSYEKHNGEMSNIVKRMAVSKNDSVATIIFNIETKKVILVKQFRYPTFEHDGGWIIEVVAGNLEKNENLAEAIKREVLEETGYNVDKLTYLFTFYLSPGFLTERIHLYYCEVKTTDQVETGGGLISEDEDIKIVQFTVKELLEKINNKEINDAKTLISALWFINARGERI